MAEEVEMTPVEMTPVDAVEPPKVNPLAKPGATVSALKPGLKLPPKPGLKLPTKPGATVSMLKPGLKLPPKPGATVSALKSGLKLPPKPVIRKPGETISAAPLPKPIVPVDAQGVGKLPTVEAKTMDRNEVAAVPLEAPKPLETLKSVTQKLKGITQTIPQQAILHKTGIIAETSAQTMAQKEAAKHKTARISLADAMGVAPVKNEAAPMKTIRIKRPINLPGVTSTTSTPTPVAPVTPVAPEASAAPAEAAAPEASATTAPRKTLKITRPGASVRPTGKFGIKKPQAAPTEDTPPVEDVAEIPEMPSASAAPVSGAPVPRSVAEAKPGVGTALAVAVQVAASFAVATLVWFFYENAQLPTFCGGLGWGQ